MNLSTVITRIKLNLGLNAIATPFDDIDGVITEIIQNITVPVFSIYSPCKDRLILKTYELELLEKQTDVEKYLLPDFNSRKLLYVFDVRYNNDVLTGLGYYGGGMPLLGGSLIEQVALSNAGANAVNLMIPKLTFHFEAPRTIYIYNAYTSTELVFELGFEHDKTLASIPDSASESFYNLALLDVKANLYPTMKMYSEVNTAIGNINLKIDEWAQSEDERKQLLEKWDDTYHLDGKPWYYG